MQKYIISGMSCAACSARIEKAVNELNEVRSCSVNLLTNIMIVDTDLSSEKIISTVKKAGYDAVFTSDKDDAKIENENHNVGEILKKRLIPSIILLVILMFFSMKYKTDYFSGIIQAVLSFIIMILNRQFFINGIRAVIKKNPNMDTLVSMGSLISFFYSIYILFFTSQNDLYFESAAMIVTLITIGKLLEEKAKGKTTNALQELIALSPKTAFVIREGKEIEIPVEKIKIGDIFIIRPGQNIPVDGIIVEGSAYIDESSVTGESVVVSKSVNDEVISATTNVNGILKCKAVKVGEDTVLSQIIKLVSDSTATKAPVQRIADKVAGVFVPSVLLISIITFVVQLITGSNLEYSIQRAISVLVISCPCSLGLATPVAIMVGNGISAKHNILFKNSEALEQTGKAKIVILDKTGTITKGKPVVTSVHSVVMDEKEIIRFAYLLEKNSNHPAAKAIVNKAEQLKITEKDDEITKNMFFSDFEEIAGKGVKGKIDGNEYFCGSMPGNNGIVLTKNGTSIGMLSLEDEIKEDSIEAVRKLHESGLKVIVLTGDNKYVAEKVGKAVGADEVISEASPMKKESVIQKYKKEGSVIMVGDGINDAPSLASCDVGMAIGAGSDIAIESASVVLVRNSLIDVSNAIKLSRRVLRNIYENLGWAFIYNIIGIPLAAGCFTNLLGWSLSPVFSALAMSLSSFCVVMNALRLYRIKLI